MKWTLWSLDHSLYLWENLEGSLNHNNQYRECRNLSAVAFCLNDQVIDRTTPSNNIQHITKEQIHVHASKGTFNNIPWKLAVKLAGDKACLATSIGIWFTI